MVVQHNMQAMNASRMLGITTGNQSKATEKLSSGYRINRAADDAAGLSISEKMRKQIRGLDQASTNAQDGISCVQTAEGALTEVHSMLQRMNELSVQAANGTLSEDDRQNIQDEIEQLTTEIDRVSETTKFNETYLLKGDKDATKAATFKYSTYSAAKAATVTDAAGSSAIADSTSGLKVTVTFNADATQDDQNAIAKALVNQGVNVGYTSTWPSTDTTATSGYTLALNGTAASEYSVVATATDAFEIQDAKGNKVADVKAEGGVAVAAEGDPDKSASATITASQATAAEGKNEVIAYYDKDGNKIAANALDNYFSIAADGNVATRVDAPTVYDALGNKATLAADDVTGARDLTGALTLNLHVGADATTNNQISINIESMSAKGLGINGLKVDESNALGAIDTIKEAIKKVSEQRSALGAVQNRLEHTIANLDNVVENTTAAESRIRDTDMAEMMVEYSKNNILAQAGQSMLAQANQSTQGVLSLLQ